MGVEFIKCTNCKGTGRIPVGSNSHKLMKCPVCKGIGKKKVTK